MLLYVPASSVLGLSLGMSTMSTPHSPLFSSTTLVGDLYFWGQSVPADVVFVAASLGVAFLGTRSSTPKWVSLLLAGVGSFVTYEISLAVWLGTVMHGGGNPTFFVFYFGYPGLIFASLAPLAWRMIGERPLPRAARATSPAGVA